MHLHLLYLSVAAMLLCYCGASRSPGFAPSPSQVARFKRLGSSPPAHLQAQPKRCPAPITAKFFWEKEATLESSGIVPDVYASTAPFTVTSPMQVKFASWVESATDFSNPFSLPGAPVKGAGLIERGDLVTPTQTQSAPELVFEGSEGEYFTAVMIDLDWRGGGQFVHWVRMNIAGDDTAEGSDFYKYVGAMPAKGKRARYAILLYKQSELVTRDEDDFVGMTAAGRVNWNVADYAEQQKLEGPVGWHHFVSDHDGYVVEISAQLAGKAPSNTQ